MSKHEITVMAEKDGLMVLMDRCTIDAKNTADAASKYAAMFGAGLFAETVHLAHGSLDVAYCGAQDGDKVYDAQALTCEPCKTRAADLLAGVADGGHCGGYDDYDEHSTENEPDWPEYEPDEEPRPSWVGWTDGAIV